MDRKYRMKKVYHVRVDGRCFETTDKPERKDELMEILPQFYPNGSVTVEEKLTREYYYV